MVVILIQLQCNMQTLILGASDPGARVGSGGATLNAVLVVCEHMSSLAGFTVRTLTPVPKPISEIFAVDEHSRFKYYAWDAW